MDEIDLREVHRAIVSSFQRDEFKRHMQNEFRYALADNGSFEKDVDAVLTDIDKGRLRELIAVVARERPLRGDVQKLYRKYAATSVAEQYRIAVDAEVAKANQQTIRDEPPVQVQQAGVTVATVQPGEAGLEKTLNDDLGFFDAALFSSNFELMRHRVCRVELNDSTPENSTTGTGFLVGPQAVLTNYHVLDKVIDGPHEAKHVKFRFDYSGELPGTLVGLNDPTKHANWLLSYAPYSVGEVNDTPDEPPPKRNELDYALVLLDKPIGNSENRGWIKLPEAALPVKKLPFLSILQYPKREPLSLALDTVPISELTFDGLRLRYKVNTDDGSSGSPVFDKEWWLVAMHHYGDRTRKPPYNQGVPSWLIRAHAAQTPAALAALGGAIDSGRRLEAAVAAAKAISADLAADADVHADKVVANTEQAADKVPALPLVDTDNMRRVIDDKFEAAIGRLTEGMNSSDRAQRAKAVAEFNAEVCDLLKNVMRFNGGILPNRLYHWWVNCGCA